MNPIEFTFYDSANKLLKVSISEAAVQSPTTTLQNANIIADGNSYVEATGTYTPFTTYIMNTAPFTTNGATMKNFGFGGQTTGQMMADQNSQILSQYNPNVLNILLVVEGGNDIYTYGDDPGAFNRYKQYCLNAKAVGFKVIASTCLLRGQASAVDNQYWYNIKLNNFNQRLINDPTAYDRIIRPDLEPIFASFTSGGYDSDNIHPNNVGYRKFADLFIAQMLTL